MASPRASRSRTDPPDFLDSILLLPASFAREESTPSATSRSARARVRALLAFVLVAVLVRLPGAALFAAPRSELESNSARAWLPGLLVAWDDGRNRALELVPKPSLALAPGESPHPAVAPSFRAEWTGALLVFEAGTYHLRAANARVLLDGLESAGEPRELAPGYHDLRVVTRRDADRELLVELRWRSELFVDEPVPARALVHESSPDVDARLEPERGRRIVEDFACASCHEGAPRFGVAVRGPHLAARATPRRRAWLARFLANPYSAKPATIMPQLLSPDEARDVAAFLSPAVSGSSPAASREEHDPPEDSVEARKVASAPDPLLAHAAFRGRELWTSIGCAACHGDAPRDLGSLRDKWPRDALVSYIEDPARVHPASRMPSLLLDHEEAVQLAAALLAGTPTPRAAPPAGDSDDRHRHDRATRAGISSSGEAARGRSLMAERGCLRCHEIRGDSLVDRSRAPAWAELRDGFGCLALPSGAGAARRGAPTYEFDADLRAAIGAFLRSSPRPDPAYPAPAREARRRRTRLQCVACHEVDGDGPSPLASSLVDRAPPLDDIGAKLRTPWLRSVLRGEARLRSHRLLRMPRFSDVWIDGLAEALVAEAGVETTTDALAPSSEGEGSAAPTPPPTAAKSKARGRDLLGRDGAAGGLACVACHAWGDVEPLADERGPELLAMTARLRFDWFRRWMYDPARIVSGTPMPQFFPPPATRDSDDAVAALWSALAAGESLPPPVGLGTLPAGGLSEALPVPGRRAVIVRFPLRGTSAATISVGLPRRPEEPVIAYAFDAATCTLAFAWEGGFLDLSGSLGKTRDDPRILGDIRYTGAGFPLRFEERDRVPKVRFRGYRLLENDVPEFRYLADSHEVRETIVVHRGGGITRRFRIDRIDGEAWFLARESEGARISSSISSSKNREIPLPRAAPCEFDIVFEWTTEPPVATGGGR